MLRVQDNPPAKQDGKRKRSSLLIISLRREPDPRVCPVEHLKEYLKSIKPDPGEVKSLLLSVTELHRPVTISATRHWIMCALREIGVKAAPGSNRSAAVTYSLVSNISVNKILETADWSFNSVQSIYKTTPPEALKRLAGETIDVQAGVMNQLPDPDPKAHSGSPKMAFLKATTSYQRRS